MTERVIQHILEILPIVASVAGAFFLALLLFWAIRKTVIKTRNQPLSTFRDIKKPFVLLFTLAALQISLSIHLGTLGELWAQLFQIAFIVIMSWLLVRLVSIVRELLEQQYDFDQANNLKARKVYTQIKVFERIIVILIVIAAISLSLMTFEAVRNIGASILASAGITGIIVGLAAQKLIANLLAGLQLAITQPIRIDDVVIVQNEWGNVEEITLTYVVIKIWDQRRLVVPSTHFIEQPFQNWTRKNSEILGTVFIYLDYKFKVDVLREKLTTILEASDLWDRRVNVIQVTNFTEKTMELRALFSARNAGDAWNLRVHVREVFIGFLQSEYPDSLPKARITIEKPDAVGDMVPS